MPMCVKRTKMRISMMDYTYYVLQRCMNVNHYNNILRYIKSLRGYMDVVIQMMVLKRIVINYKAFKP